MSRCGSPSTTVSPQGARALPKQTDENRLVKGLWAAQKDGLPVLRLSGSVVIQRKLLDNAWFALEKVTSHHALCLASHALVAGARVLREIEPQAALGYIRCTMDDPCVIEAFREGKQEAFEALVDLHGDRLFRSAVLRCGSEQVAEDLVQETFLRAFRAASAFRGQSAVFTWLYGILLNVNRKRSRNIFRLIFTDQVPEREAEATVGPASLADAAATAVLVSEALQQLYVKHREVIVLHYYENMPIDDIARQLRVGSGTVKSRLHYARKQLRALLPDGLNHFA